MPRTLPPLTAHYSPLTSLLIGLAVLGLSPLSKALAQTPLGTAFTYQGRLKSGGSPANGSFNMDFKLYPVPAGGTLLASQTLPGVSVSDGLFTIQVDFGAGVFDGNQRWLDVTVDGTPLVPRQELTAAPHAHFALNAATANNATQLNGQPGAFYQNASNISSGTLADVRLSTNVAILNNSQTFTALKRFSVAPSFTDPGVPFSVTSTTLVANLNADRLDGLDSTAFLQSIPVPLTLSAASDAQVLLVQNPTNFSGASAIRGEATGGLSIGNAGVFGQSTGVIGTGVFGMSTSTGTAGGFGVQGHAASPNGRGVYGEASALTGETYGGRFESASTDGRGVYGLATAATGTTYGVYGQSDSPDGRGVYGLATNNTGVTCGVLGETNSTLASFPDSGGRGVMGVAAATSGTSAAGYFINDSISAPNSAALVCIGDFYASGNKGFRIDHPDDPANKYLLHYAAESPEVINFYSETVTLNERGEAVVQLPHYFAKINTRPRYQLTAVGAPMPMLHVAEEIDEAALSIGAKAEPDEAAPPCSFRIAGGKAGAKVSWRVEALRNDRWVQQRGAPVEGDKQDLEKGTYQHPELYGQPPEKGTDYDATRQRPQPERPSPPVLSEVAPR